MKPHLLDFDLASFNKLLTEEFAQKSYVSKQLFSWIHQKGVLDVEQMSNIGKNIKQSLGAGFSSELPKILNTHVSLDGTTKILFGFDKGNAEAVWIPHTGRNTICVSTQVGCPVKCTFCASGYQKFTGNLDTSEIVAQVWYFKYILGVKVTNVVFMGMGEPLLNFHNVLATCNILTENIGYNLSHRKVTISTSGIVPRIYDMIGKTNVALALSLHAASDEVRSSIIPINEKYPLDELIKAVNAYIDSLEYMRRSITIEYTLIKDINDSNKDANDLLKLLQKFTCRSKINLIPFNEHSFVDYKTISNERLYTFANILNNAGYITTIRNTRGDNIKAACGQLSATTVPTVMDELN